MKSLMVGIVVHLAALQYDMLTFKEYKYFRKCKHAFIPRVGLFLVGVYMYPLRPTRDNHV